MDFDIGRFHAGEETLFAELVRSYSPRLLAYLRRYAATSMDAQDLLQDLWLHAYTKRAMFDGRGSLYGWLLSVGRTVGMAAVRKRERVPTMESLPEIPAQFDPDAGMLGQTLQDAVLALPERQRDAILLRLVEGLSTADTARVMQCAEGTVKASLHQATRKLREHLKEMVR